MRALAPVFGMPAFAPHATVQGDLDLSADDAEMLARELVAGEGRLQRGNAILAGAPGLRGFLESTLGDLMDG